MKAEIKYRGISRSMSDMGVADGGVAECANMIVDNGELAPVVAPKLKTEFSANKSYDLWFIHKSSAFSQPHHICVYNNTICWMEDDTQQHLIASLQSGEQVKAIKAIGNTLIISTNQRLLYALWKQGLYIFLGPQVPNLEAHVIAYPNTSESDFWVFTGMPEALISAGVAQDAEAASLYCKAAFNGQEIKYSGEPGYEDEKVDIGGDHEKLSRASIGETISRAVWTQIADAISQSRANSRLRTPVFVRLAFRLYDGTSICQTAPVLLDASTNSSFLLSSYVQKVAALNADNYKLAVKLPKEYEIAFSVEPSTVAQIANWQDIITGIDVYLSEPIYLNKYGARIKKTNSPLTSLRNVGETTNATWEAMSGDELSDMLLTKSNFYLVKQIAINEVSGGTYIRLNNISHKLGDNLLAQRTLQDDYRSNHRTWAENIFELNSRLSLLNIHTQYYPGSVYPSSEVSFSPNPTGVYMKYHIKGEDGVEIITSKGVLSYPGPWITYPDARCYYVELYWYFAGVWRKSTIQMEPHPFLNCAYAFAGFGLGNVYYDNTVVSGMDPTVQDVDRNVNKIYQSEVNNPFLYPLTGRHTISGGEIIGVATTTKAISQGQFGQYPLYVFCAEGIWAMQTAADGTFQSIAPLSRDVCSNVNSITGIDGAIIFATKRGIMILTADTVKCISEDMIGKHFRADSLAALEEICSSHFGSELPQNISDDKSFVDYIQNCFIAYDYANARLIIVNGDCKYQYVYSLTNGTWHKISFGIKFKRALNSYPDCYLQSEDPDGDAVYNFSIMDDINDINVRTTGLIVSRAVFFEDNTTLKIIQRIKHIGNFDKEYFSLLLYGSRDGINYRLVTSLKGSSYKYYRIAIVAKLLPTERISSTIIDYDIRFSNKIR